MMKRLVVRNVMVVGMHHYGEKQLSVGSYYRIEIEPNNPYDETAVAVYDGNIKVANLKRDCAKALFCLMQENRATSKYFLKPLENAQVRSRRTGPEQLSVVAFQCPEEFIRELTNKAENYPCIHVVSMNLKSQK